MKKIHVPDLPESFSVSPKGKYARGLKDISVALGRNPDSTDLRERHPFDVQLCRIPAGKMRSPYHLHTAQYEYFQVLAGSGSVRHAGGTTPVVAGDAFFFEPGEAHQLIADGPEDFVLLVVADNPLSEGCYYPDSNKWLIAKNDEAIMRAPAIPYFDGEE